MVGYGNYVGCRVTEYIRDKSNIVIIAPHANNEDDQNTGIIAAVCADYLEADLIVNWGFKKSDKVDLTDELADCNRLDHLHTDVVKQEFLNPVVNCLQSEVPTKSKKGTPNKRHVFIIHGMGQNSCDELKKKYEAEPLVVIGYGRSEKKDALTNIPDNIDRLSHAFYNVKNSKTADKKVMIGVGGKFAGRSKNNLNQINNELLALDYIRSTQIEIPFEFRQTENHARDFGKYLAEVIYMALDNKKVTEKPSIIEVS